MPRAIAIDEFLTHADQALLIDVRSPSEYQQGHIPGAANCPLFSDEERAKVGTCYKHEGKQEAVLLGLDIVGPKMRRLAEDVHELLAGRDDSRHPEHADIRIHCWRGGMRSQSFSWLLEQTGLKPTILTGGYKAFRRAAQAAFAAERRIVVLSGMTGAGKTRKLEELATAGEQVLDLEGFAHHRGSSFGAIGLPPQPTCEQFENRVFMQLQKLDPHRVVWTEDESPSIGKVRVPHELWWNMRRSPALFLNVDRNTRAENLAAEYGELSQEHLAEATQRLEKKLGRPQIELLVRWIEQEDYRRAAYELLEYYDKTYQHAAKRRPREHVFQVDGNLTSAELIARADEVLRFAELAAEQVMQ